MENLLKVCELKVTYKKTGNKMPKITCSKDSAKIFVENWKEDINHRETSYMLALSKSNRVQGIWLISIGGISSCLMDIKTIFQTALLCNSSSIIIAHNHPSGNLEESTADSDVCKRIKAAGKTLDIELLDFMIITEDGYFSYADDGIL